jgi:hypothetical protein
MYKLLKRLKIIIKMRDEDDTGVVTRANKNSLMASAGTAAGVAKVHWVKITNEVRKWVPDTAEGVQSASAGAAGSVTVSAQPASASATEENRAHAMKCLKIARLGMQGHTGDKDMASCDIYGDVGRMKGVGKEPEQFWICHPCNQALLRESAEARAAASTRTSATVNENGKRSASGS